MREYISDGRRADSREYRKEQRQREEAERLQAEFAGFDCSQLIKMSSNELVAWQTKHPTDSPQYKAAQNEWDRRAARVRMAFDLRVVLLSFISGVFASVLTTFLTNWLFR